MCIALFIYNCMMREFSKISPRILCTDLLHQNLPHQPIVEPLKAIEAPVVKHPVLSVRTCVTNQKHADVHVGDHKVHVSFLSFPLSMCSFVWVEAVCRLEYVSVPFIVVGT